MLECLRHVPQDRGRERPDKREMDTSAPRYCGGCGVRVDTGDVAVDFLEIDEEA